MVTVKENNSNRLKTKDLKWTMEENGFSAPLAHGYRAEMKVVENEVFVWSLLKKGTVVASGDFGSYALPGSPLNTLNAAALEILNAYEEQLEL